MKRAPQKAGKRGNPVHRIESRVVPAVEPDPDNPRRVRREFEELLAGGARWRVAGRARKRPRRLLELGYLPSHRFELFGTKFFLANARQNEDIRFFVAYLCQRPSRPGPLQIYPRIFYKDVSLVWRSASHFARSDEENWIGKGDVATVVRDGETMVESAEETTDLPFEIQQALELILRRRRRVVRDEEAISLILRQAPDHRVIAYNDFIAPRRRAAANPKNRINGGRPICSFEGNRPESLRFVDGFEPDFRRGVRERDELRSRLYGGSISRYRVIARNEQIQFLFFVGPKHVWLGHPQATTTEIMSYGVRTLTVDADERLSIPGFEFHFVDEFEDPPSLYSQIPEGFAGPPSSLDPYRCDASAWIDRMPVVRRFRRQVLGV